MNEETTAYAGPQRHEWDEVKNPQGIIELIKHQATYLDIPLELLRCEIWRCGEPAPVDERRGLSNVNNPQYDNQKREFNADSLEWGENSRGLYDSDDAAIPYGSFSVGAWEARVSFAATGQVLEGFTGLEIFIDTLADVSEMRQ